MNRCRIQARAPASASFEDWHCLSRERLLQVTVNAIVNQRFPRRVLLDHLFIGRKT